jgi:uncharacterized protein YdhG (YjbR/CyaY superfamily)
MRSEAETVEEYLAELPEDRREALTELRAAIVENLPDGVVETMNWGMISYEIPLEIEPDTYNGKPLSYAGLASQKQHMAVYLMGVYGSPALRQWFADEWRASGKRVDMGKSCIRFKKLADAPVGLIAEAIRRVSMEDVIAASKR